MIRLLPFHTLRGRLTLLACLATLPAFLFAVYVASEERASALRRAEQESVYVANLASHEHALQVLGARNLLDRLVTIAHTHPEDDLPRLLPTILSGFPQFANLGVLGLDGKILYSVAPAPGEITMLGVSAFQRALQSHEVAMGTYLVGLIVERPILIMAKALRDAEGQPTRVFFVALDLAWFDKLAKQVDLPAGSALLIVDRDGTILASSIGRSLDTRTGRRLDGFQQLMQHPDTLTRCIAPDGVPRLAVARRLAEIHDVWVVAGPPEEGIHALANRVFFRDIVVLSLLGLFTIMASLIVTDYSVLHDIRMLAAATRRFGSGELRARAPVPSSHGEIRDLTLAFNSMAATLELRDHQAIQVQERLRALSHRLQTAREEEAARIAQELHDELGQELSVLRLELERLLRRVAASGRLPEQDAIVAMIEELGERIDATVRSVRRISSDLRPGVLDRLGLSAGIEWLLGGFERRTGIHISLVVEGAEQKVDTETSTALFRITQEALTNVARHSGASTVMIRLAISEQDCVLWIQDDGCGFDPATETATPSLGLLGMKERASRLGGMVRISSAPGKGTAFSVTIPRNPFLA